MRIMKDLQGRDAALIAGVTLIVAVLSLLPMGRLLVELVAPRDSFRLRRWWKAWQPVDLDCDMAFAADWHWRYRTRARVRYCCGVVGRSHQHARTQCLRAFLCDPAVDRPQVTALACSSFSGLRASFSRSSAWRADAMSSCFLCDPAVDRPAGNSAGLAPAFRAFEPVSQDHRHGATWQPQSALFRLGHYLLFVQYGPLVFLIVRAGYASFHANWWKRA